MNNACPSCGAIYNVAEKDIGRRIRCKKCSSALTVTEAGLELEDAAAAATVAPADTGRDDDEEIVAPKRGRGRDRDRDRRPAGPGFDLGGAVRRIGGVPTLLFGFGVFLVVFTGFQDAIGRAKIERRKAAYDEGRMEHDREIKAINENKDLKESDKTDRIDKENKRWEREEKDLKAAQDIADYSNRKSGYIDKYYLLFGFLFIAFGCLGYLMADQALLLRVVAAVILVAMILALFKLAVGTGAGVGARIDVG